MAAVPQTNSEKYPNFESKSLYIYPNGRCPTDQFWEIFLRAYTFILMAAVPQTNSEKYF